MLLRNVNMSPFNAVFQARPKTLQAVDVRGTVHIFARAVINRLMVIANSFQALIGTKFVSVDGRSLDDVLFNDRLQILAGNGRNNFRHHLAVTLQHSENDSLAFRTTAPNASATTANISFVNLDMPKEGKFALYGQL